MQWSIKPQNSLVGAVFQFLLRNFFRCFATGKWHEISMLYSSCCCLCDKSHCNFCLYLFFFCFLYVYCVTSQLPTQAMPSHVSRLTTLPAALWITPRPSICLTIFILSCYEADLVTPRSFSLTRPALCTPAQPPADL